jgi:peptide-methionine (S)-S-oxide reductase
MFTRWPLVIVLILLTLCAAAKEGKAMGNTTEGAPQRSYETVTLGGGCFWCLEAVFEELKGVTKVESGYSGGSAPNPTYKQVCAGKTGHAEVVQVTFDPKVIPLKEIYRVFFAIHDPTTPNRQGADVGTQYRSIILYRDEAQKHAAEEVIRELKAAKAFESPIVTELFPLEVFYIAEGYHQEYYENNSSQSYCQLVISPKLAKFRNLFKDKLKN